MHFGAEMTEFQKESRRGRPDQVLFSPGSLKVLAHLLNERSSEISSIADALQANFPNGSVQLGYPKAISDGLLAIVAFVEDLKKKINDGKVISVITSDQLLSGAQDAKSRLVEKFMEEAQQRRNAEGLGGGGSATPKDAKPPKKSPKK